MTRKRGDTAKRGEVPPVVDALVRVQKVPHQEREPATEWARRYLSVSVEAGAFRADIAHDFRA
jgi:hypothetical protein